MRYDTDMEGHWGRTRPGFGGRARGYDAGARGHLWPRDQRRAEPSSRYGADYWWLGEREMERRGYGGSYDAAYRRFSEETHPRYSPVGGMYHATGGSYSMRRLPRPLREPMRFSEWTRWF